MSIKNSVRNIAIAGFVMALAASAADAAHLMWSETLPDPARADRSSDPVEDQVRRETMAKLPELRQKPAPFLRLSIPEPMEVPRLLGMREVLSENEPPAAATGNPPRPVLSVVAPAKP